MSKRTNVLLIKGYASYRLWGKTVKRAFLPGLALAFIMSSPVVAATIGYTEGTRNTVVGTTEITPDDTSPLPGSAYDLLQGGGTALGASLDAGESIEIYGRIVRSVDNFLFINAASAFTIDFIFGGYEFFDSGTAGSTTNASVSGLTGDPADGGSVGKDVTFRLLDANNAFAELDSATYTSAFTAGDANIFSGGPGNYVFQIDGLNTSDDALYDVSITGVPLPAAGWMLLAGIGGIAAMKRRKKA